MRVFDCLLARAKEDPRIVVLPEIGKEAELGGPAVLQDAACLVREEGIAQPMALSREMIGDSGKLDEFAELYCELRGMTGDRKAAMERMLMKPPVFGAMMVRAGYAHGMVCGKYTSSFTVMAAVRTIIPQEPGHLASSMFLLETPEGYPVFSVMGIADVVVNTNPTPEEIASIVVTSCETFEALTGRAARAAIMSYSTGTSGSGPLVDKVHAAMEAYNKRNAKWMVFGPCQVDAALYPNVARNKKGCPFTDEPANLLVGSNLDVANCIYKTFRWLVPGSRSMLCSQGLSLPVDDLSRGDEVDDVVNVIAANVVKSQVMQQRHGGAGIDPHFAGQMV